MHLEFLGTGGGFNTALGNTSAYYKENENLLLIDCGETVFSKIMELNLLDGIKKVFFMCTHTHSDHVGSLGNFCLYCHYSNISFYVIVPDAILYSLCNLLEVFHCKGFWGSMSLGDLSAYFVQIEEAKYIWTEHCKDACGANIPAYMIHFRTSDGHILYSGDTNKIDKIEGWINCQRNNIAHMYIEASSEGYGVHLALDDIDRVVPPRLRNRCTLMHFDNQECIERAKALGFQIASSE